MFSKTHILHLIRIKKTMVRITKLARNLAMFPALKVQVKHHRIPPSSEPEYRNLTPHTFDKHEYVDNENTYEAFVNLYVKYNRNITRVCASRVCIGSVCGSPALRASDTNSTNMVREKVPLHHKTVFEQGKHTHGSWGRFFVGKYAKIAVESVPICNKN